MSIYVGWLQWGYVRIYNEATEETTSHKITAVESDLTTFDKSLDELQTIVKVADVKQLVFVHSDYDTKTCKSIVERLTDRGFKSVYVQHWMSNRLQTSLLKQNTEFTEDQHFLFAVKGKRESLMVWNYCNSKIEFVKFGPIISTSENDLSTHSEEVVQLFHDFKIEKMINMGCHHIPSIVEKSFPASKVVSQNAIFTADDFTTTALWTAKRQDGLVDGVEVGNFCWTGIRIRSGGNTILDKRENGMALPFNRTTKWKSYKSALTAFTTFGDLQYKLKLPVNQSCRTHVDIDRNGLSKIYVELKCILGISLSQDSFYVVRSSNSMDGKMISIGQFPTALRFDCDPPKLALSAFEENVISDAIEMLDPEQQPKNGWKPFRTVENTFEFCKVLESNEEAKVITASYAVSELFNNIHLLVSDVPLDSNGYGIALSRFLTQKQQEKLKIIFKLKQQNFVDEILAAAYGYSVENGIENGVNLVVDLRTTGCIFNLLWISNDYCEQLVQEEFAELKSEVVRQAMQITFAPSAFAANDQIKAEMRKIFAEFHQAVVGVVGAEQSNVKTVLLIGSCHLVPNINELFAWSFFHAKIVVLEESEVCRLAATGSILLLSK